jgi:hypothetical protein
MLHASAQWQTLGKMPSDEDILPHGLVLMKRSYKNTLIKVLQPPKAT